MIENEDDVVDASSQISLTSFPPTNAFDDNTDEDSGDENTVTLENLRGSQLRTETEVELIIDSDNSENIIEKVDMEGEVQEGNGRKEGKQNDNDGNSISSDKRKKIYHWEKCDLLENNNHECSHNCVVPNNATPSKLFFSFFDDEIIEMLVIFTNQYAAKHNRMGDVTSGEMKSFIAILLLSGYIEVPRRNMYWETRSDSHNSLVAVALSRDRFKFIMTNLHVCDNDNLNKSDRYTKVRGLFDMLNTRFQDNAPHEENHTVDEAMVPYFGKHGCKQFICGKPIRYGYKIWTGATRNGYILWMEPYQSSSTTLPENYKHLGLEASAVHQYADVLLNLGKHSYHLFFDNYFTSLPLLTELRAKGIRGTGTMRENRTS